MLTIRDSQRLERMRDFNQNHPDTVWHAYELTNPKAALYGYVSYIPVGTWCKNKNKPLMNDDYTYLGVVNVNRGSIGDKT